MILSQEDKELLIKDLSARLPYNVYVYFKTRYRCNAITDVLDGAIYTYIETHLLEDDGENEIDIIKPYLRPMSSMTEEEKLHMKLKFHFFYSDGVLNNVHIFEAGGTYDRDGNYEPPTTYRELREVNMDLILEFIHWLNKKMFDYRGLIEKGLAIEVTNENNPYT